MSNHLTLERFTEPKYLLDYVLSSKNKYIIMYAGRDYREQIIMYAVKDTFKRSVNPTILTQKAHRTQIQKMGNTHLPTLNDVLK